MDQGGIVVAAVIWEKLAAIPPERDGRREEEPIGGDSTLTGYGVIIYRVAMPLTRVARRVAALLPETIERERA